MMEAQLVMQAATRGKTPVSNFKSEKFELVPYIKDGSCRKIVGLIAPISGDRSMTSRSGRVFRVLNIRF